MASRTLDETACRAGVFRFQNIRIPKYSAYTLSLPDGTAAKFAVGEKAALGLRTPVCETEYKGILIFLHSHTPARQAVSSSCFYRAFHKMKPESLYGFAVRNVSHEWLYVLILILLF